MADSLPGARAAIPDLTGRWVRVLFEGTLPAAARDLSRDERDDGGRDVAAGVYLDPVSTEGQAMTRRRVLLR